MGNLSKATQSIIDKLGYSISGNLFYYKDIALNKELSLHDIKILNELKPCAFYCVDHKPFVLFFEEKENVEVMNELHKKIWNSQIPVIIFNNISSIKVYYGNFLKIDKNELELINNQNIDLCDEFSPFSYWNVTNQNFWSTFENQFTKKKLNEILLENIQSVTTTLKGKYNISFATKLILRLIFIRFLIDRGVDLGYKGFSSNIKASQKTLLEISKNKETLYDLFTYLKITFNGNLFDLGDELVDENLSDKVFMLLNEFLSGEYVLSSGQKSLFELYDFNIIPVELISNIYEVLLGKILQTKDKAFYTPIYLVDYILNHTIKPFIKFNNKCKILDPSCGEDVIIVTRGKNTVFNGVLKLPQSHKTTNWCAA